MYYQKNSRKMSVPPTYLTVDVQYNNSHSEYDVSVKGPYVPKTSQTAKSLDELLRLLAALKEYHSVHYDGQEGRAKLPFWIHFCNRFDAYGNLEDNDHRWFSSVPQFAKELGELPHHLFVEAENDDSD